MPQRHAIVGAPHTYYVAITAAFRHPVFQSAADITSALTVLEQVREAFACRCHALAVTTNALHLIIHHPPLAAGNDDYLRARWMASGGRAQVTSSKLRERLGSLSGFMQTLLQRLSRDWNHRHHSRGSLWASRYRACLLADDSAVLAAIAWLEEEVGNTAEITSRHIRHDAHPAVRLAAPPLRIGPDNQWFPTDDGPPGIPPPANDDLRLWLDRIASELGSANRRAYGEALQHGWALGRPESLTAPLSRLARGAGRGRSRRLRQLADDLGLCGVWG